jgi:hypothetical protein
MDALPAGHREIGAPRSTGYSAKPVRRRAIAGPVDPNARPERRVQPSHGTRSDALGPTRWPKAGNVRLGWRDPIHRLPGPCRRPPSTALPARLQARVGTAMRRRAPASTPGSLPAHQRQRCHPGSTCGTKLSAGGAAGDQPRRRPTRRPPMRSETASSRRVARNRHPCCARRRQAASAPPSTSSAPPPRNDCARVERPPPRCTSAHDISALRLPPTSMAGISANGPGSASRVAR